MLYSFLLFFKVDIITELLVEIFFKSILEALDYSEIWKQSTLKIN